MTETKFPTEIVDLPSKGHFYPEDNPLSSGKIELRYMTARDEDILTSVNLIEQGKALDKLLQALIIDKDIDYNDLLVGDKNAIFVAARILAYGKEFGFSYLDSYGERVDGKVDLTEIESKELDFSEYKKGVNLFSYTLPKSERIVTFSIPTHKSEMDVEVKRRRWQSLWLLSFFGLTPQYKTDLHEQIFQIIFYSKGGFTFTEVYDLPVYLRRFYYKRLVTQYEKEKQEHDKAMNQPNQSNQRFK